MHNQTESITKKIDEVLSHPDADQIILERQHQQLCLDAVTLLNDFYTPTEMLCIIDDVYFSFVTTLTDGIYFEIDELTSCIRHIKQVVRDYIDIIAVDHLDAKYKIAYSSVLRCVMDMPDKFGHINQLDHMFRTYLDHIPEGLDVDSDITLVVHYMKTFIMDVRKISKVLGIS